MPGPASLFTGESSIVARCYVVGAQIFVFLDIFSIQLKAHSYTVPSGLHLGYVLYESGWVSVILTFPCVF